MECKGILLGYFFENVWFCYAYAWENNCQHSLWCRQTEYFRWNAKPAFYKVIHGKCHYSLSLQEIFCDDWSA